MIIFHEDYVIDHQGQKKAVISPYDEWEKIIEELEELEDIRLYDNAKKKNHQNLFLLTRP